MTNFIPIFPLAIVVYPHEMLNLHIFEPRYIQLIKECRQEKKSFGIPSVIDNEVKEYGTLMEITSVEKIYDNEEMDIRVRGTKVFRMLEIIREVPDKLYSGAVVNYPENNVQGNPQKMKKIIDNVSQLHKILQVTKEFSKTNEALTSYDIGHHVGFSLQEEYEMLELLNELQREEYLKRHLKKVIPMMIGMENLRERIKLNGHFNNLSVDSF